MNFAGSFGQNLAMLRLFLSPTIGGITMFNAIHLTPADIAKIEEGMNTEDVEHMVAIVDRIVARRLAKAQTTQPSPRRTT